MTKLSLPLVCLLLLAHCKQREAPQQPPGRIRPAAHAGSWYPAEPDALRAAIQQRLAEHPPTQGAAPIVAMIGPHAGLRFSGAVAAAGYGRLRGQGVKRIFLLGPSHRAGFSGIALPAPDLGAYATPLGDLIIDRQAVERLRGRPGFDGPAMAHDQEHSLEMHAIFIAAVAPKASLLPLVVGQVGSHARAVQLAQELVPLLRAGDVVIASSDFTHYGPNYRYVPFHQDVPAGIDRLLQQATSNLVPPSPTGFEQHLIATKDTICGRDPLRILLALLPAGVLAHKAAQDTSGRMVSDYTNSVSYLTALYRHADGWAPAPVLRPKLQQGPEVLKAVDRALALRMARSTVRTFLHNGRVQSDDDLNVPAKGPLRDVYGAFVTLKKKGELRGCIGHIFPTAPLWRAIRDNAISAAVRDPRFPPVQASELPELELEISVLTPPHKIPAPEAFEVGRHGIVLHVGNRRATFLPQVAPEQGWDMPTTLSHLARKAGLAATAWRDARVELSVYEAQVFAEQHREN